MSIPVIKEHNKDLVDSDRDVSEITAVELVPTEGYVEETKNDGSKGFRCKQFDKSIKTETSWG